MESSNTGLFFSSTGIPSSSSSGSFFNNSDVINNGTQLSLTTDNLNRLSAGEIGGAVAGSILGTLALAGCLFFGCRKRKEQRSVENRQPVPLPAEAAATNLELVVVTPPGVNTEGAPNGVTESNTVRFHVEYN